MRLAADYVRPYRGYRRKGGKVRIRIYEEAGSAPVVICSEVPDNAYPRVTNVAEYLCAETILSHALPRPVWIEHYPPESRPGYAETFDLVTFSSYEPEEVLVAGARRVKVGTPERKPLDRATVETLVRGHV